MSSVKWSDYVITAVAYNAAHTHIVQVHVREFVGSLLSGARIYSRQQVVSLIKQGRTFVTSREYPSGTWNKGEDVRIETIRNVDYIRTDNNSKESDNLGSLPEFQPA